jgi:PmbA protein
MSVMNTLNYKDFLNSIIRKAKAKGVDYADVVLIHSEAESIDIRLGKIENVTRDESKGFGLRIIKDNKQATLSSNDFSSQSVDELLSRAMAMAEVISPDPYIGFASEKQFAKTMKDLDLYESSRPSTAALLDMAKATEDAALSVKGVTNSNGAGANYSDTSVYLAATNGFYNEYNSSSKSISTSVIAGDGVSMQRDYAYSVARHLEDLKSAREVGLDAGRRAVKKLSPKKIKSAEMPIIFEPRVARGLLGNLASAINGVSVALGTSFLKDQMGKQIFGEGINIIDNPLVNRGLNSKPFDGETIPTRKKTVIEDGVLKSWLLDIKSANQLGLVTTGNASRGLGSAPSPSPTNFYLEAGKESPEVLIKSIKNGIFVTEMLGQGGNIINGEFSQGIAGFMIENGELAYPISEITIASNMIEMFKLLTPANDLKFEFGINSPTLMVERMTVAGV